MSITHFYLNSDHSIQGTYNSDTNHVILSSDHTNANNDRQIVENIRKIMTIKANRTGADILLGDDVYVRINSEKGTCETKQALTSFETRIASRKSSEYSLPFDRSKKPAHLQTDLHTHFAGALSPEQLIECGIGTEVYYPSWLIKKLGLDVAGLTPNERGAYLLEDIISSQKNKDTLVAAMKIDTSEQETFNKMEDIYAARGPITKNPYCFLPIVWSIAKDCQNTGVKYIELSLSSIISDMSQLKILEENLPRIEKQTGVKVRFLGALSRHSDKEWNDDEVEKLKISSRSPYIVGCDVMGHETNPTTDFFPHIKALAKNAMQNDPDFVIRVHAGENVLFKTNVRQVLLAVEEAHHELEAETGKKFQFPQVRIGHGLYGFDEPASWDENERTSKISTLELFKLIDPVVEFNMSSNLSLNNIDGISQIPIKKYLDQGIRVVLGTDGRGIYSTSIEDEMIIAHAAGVSYDNFEKIAKTEKQIIERDDERFRRLAADKRGNSFNIAVDQKGIVPHYTQEVEQKYNKELQETQKRLQEMIKGCGAVTDPAQIEADLAGKTPILLTGSSHKHFPKIAVDHPEQLTQIQIALDALVNLIDPKKAYIMTGGTNHGVEREMHILANKYNQTAKDKVVVLGTLTEEAAKNSISPDERVRNTNKIESNTITHAITPIKDGKIAKRWFDLPDTVLDMVQQQKGVMVAIGGGAIVGDMIMRGHNMGINMHIMSSVEGASKEKSQSLAGYGYNFADAKALLEHLFAQNPNLFKTSDPEEFKRQVENQIRLSAEKITGKKAESTAPETAKQGKLIFKETAKEAAKNITPQQIEQLKTQNSERTRQ